MEKTKDSRRKRTEISFAASSVLSTKCVGAYFMLYKRHTCLRNNQEFGLFKHVED
jgi:hypothetical protein